MLLVGTERRSEGVAEARERERERQCGGSRATVRWRGKRDPGLKCKSISGRGPKTECCDGWWQPVGPLWAAGPFWVSPLPDASSAICGCQCTGYSEDKCPTLLLPQRDLAMHKARHAWPTSSFPSFPIPSPLGIPSVLFLPLPGSCAWLHVSNITFAQMALLRPLSLFTLSLPWQTFVPKPPSVTRQDTTTLQDPAANAVSNAVPAAAKILRYYVCSLQRTQPLLHTR